MYENNFFSHDSQDGRNLKDRLEEENIYYVSAGENIAAQHTDAPAAMEGWLNSEGHREAMLYEDYNRIGVGVHHLYYTQNFLLKRSEEHTSELQSRFDLVCRLLLEKK